MMTIEKAINMVIDKTFLGDKLNEVFETISDEYMPFMGKADTIGGEMLRAVNRIVGRYYNDGDVAGEGYGCRTVNPAVRYLKSMMDKDFLVYRIEFSVCVDYFYDCVVYGGRDCDEYAEKLKELEEDVLIFIIENKLLDKQNNDDMLDFITKEDEENEKAYYGEDDMHEDY